MDINTLITEAHQIAIDHGCWQKWGKILQALPDDLADDFESYVAEELADVVIRVADFCGWRCIDLESAIAEKMEKNRNRPYLHGGKKL